MSKSNNIIRSPKSNIPVGYWTGLGLADKKTKRNHMNKTANQNADRSIKTRLDKLSKEQRSEDGVVWEVMSSSERIFGLKPVRSLEQIRLDLKRQRRDRERQMLERENAERRQMAEDRNRRLEDDQ